MSTTTACAAALHGHDWRMHGSECDIGMGWMLAVRSSSTAGFGACRGDKRAEASHVACHGWSHGTPGTCGSTWRVRDHDMFMTGTSHDVCSRYWSAGHGFRTPDSVINSDSGIDWMSSEWEPPISGGERALGPCPSGLPAVVGPGDPDPSAGIPMIQAQRVHS